MDRNMKILAGVAGFEPTDAGIKIRCLTAWRHPNALNLMGREKGFEPSTSRTTIWRSTNWATTAILFGAPWGTRTPHTRLRRPLLYPSELKAHIKCVRYALSTLLERVMGIGPTQPAWKAGVLPLNYTRTSHNAYRLYQKTTLLSNIFLQFLKIFN